MLRRKYWVQLKHKSGEIINLGTIQHPMETSVDYKFELLLGGSGTRHLVFFKVANDLSNMGLYQIIYSWN